MTGVTRSAPVLARRPATGGSTAPGPISRLVGLGSVFGKTVRDSRRALVVELVLVGLLPMLLLSALAEQYPTPATRAELVRMAEGLGRSAQVMTGPPVNVGTIGGYLQWKYGAVLALVAAFWSVITLTRTLAGESSAGSLDLLAASPVGRRRIAAQKVGAHLALLAVVSAAAALGTGIGGSAFARLPGDRIPMTDAIGFGLWIGLLAMAFGGLAFVLSQLFGRSVGAWTSGVVLVAGQVLAGSRSLSPALGASAQLTPWGWTADHLPLAGRTDWPSLIPVAVVGVLLVVGGIDVFARRDLDAAVRLPVARGSVALPGLGGPVSRALREQLPSALAWGLGLGVFGMSMAALGRSLADSFAASPDLADRLHRVFPLYDLTTAGGFLQLMIQLMFVIAGFAAVTAVGRWTAEESSGRLDLLLSVPLARSAWAVRSGLGVLAAVVLMTALVSVGVGAGAALSGSAAGDPMLGSVSLGLFTAALVGVGFAVAGLVGPRVAGTTVAVVVVATYLIDLLAPALGLPDGVRQLALTAHLGRPMVGDWDLTGVVACLVLAVGGIALGAFGLSRRDLRG